MEVVIAEARAKLIIFWQKVMFLYVKSFWVTGDMHVNLMLHTFYPISAFENVFFYMWWTEHNFLLCVYSMIVPFLSKKKKNRMDLVVRLGSGLLIFMFSNCID